MHVLWWVSACFVPLWWIFISAYFFKKNGAGVLPFAVDERGAVHFLFHRTFRGKKQGSLIDWGGAVDATDWMRGPMWTAAREFSEEMEGLFYSDDPIGEPNPRGNIGADTTRTYEALQACHNAHPRWSVSHSFFHAHYNYRLFFLQVDHRDVGRMNARFAAECRPGARGGFHKRRELVWIDAHTLMDHLRSTDGRLFVRLHTLPGLARRITLIAHHYASL